MIWPIAETPGSDPETGGDKSDGSETTVRIRLIAGVSDEALRGADGAELAVPGKMGRRALRDLVAHLVGAADPKPDLHFLVDGTAALRTTLAKFLARRGRSAEAVVELTYYLPLPPPARRPPVRSSAVWLADVAARAVGDVPSAAPVILAGSYAGCPTLCTPAEMLVTESDVRHAAHAAPVKAVSWLESGKAFVTAGHDAVAKLWAFEETVGEVGNMENDDPDAGTLKHAAHLLAAFRAEDVALGAPFDSVAATSRDGKDLVALGAVNGSILVLDDVTSALDAQDKATRKRKRADIPDLTARHVGCTSPDLSVMRLRWRQHEDSLVSAGLDGMVRVWDVDAGVVSLTVPGGGKALTGLVESEASFLVTAADGRIRLLDARDGKGVVSVTGKGKSHAGMATDVTWLSKDGSYASSGLDGTLRAWDLRSFDSPVHVVGDVHGENARCLRLTTGLHECKTCVFSAGEDGQVQSVSFSM